MGIKDQFVKLKDNWLIIVLVIVLLLFMNLDLFGSTAMQFSEMASDSAGGAYYNTKSIRADTDDFAPGVEDRKVIKSALLSTETERGEFRTVEQKMKDIVKDSGSYILNENVMVYGTERNAYLYGSYQLKVETKKLSSVADQLKLLGEVKSFSESSVDVTGQYTNSNINLGLEQSRLERYWKLYAEAKDMEDKITLNDRIFDQERTVKYINDSINNLDLKIDYSTLQFTLTEERSNYANVAFVKFSALVRDLVSSVNGLLVFIFTVAPWAIVGLIGLVVYKKVKNHKGKK
ncbi:hypothetical protein COV93_05190 [Candidatus Woesearchaeota archaeon CG11_big_fil_rev_8_21_14_0_20_43_8]|nr:MAG: hypothetical protein COV93_05190 [Candidatus Woesearchaeota archaeon CG11_big_fil_rev_8_21_14_0_20_43_8]